MPNSSYVDIPLPPALIESWLDPSSNYGLVLDHPLAGRTTFGASEAGAASRPTLQVCYDSASCGDERQNHGETGVDCGGPCPTICCADIPETCNGIDDNCNGAIDENVTQACSTACGGGIETCAAGAWSACSAPVETCNLIDDDCNGVCDGAQCQIGVHQAFEIQSFVEYRLILTTDAALAAALAVPNTPNYNLFKIYPSQVPGTAPLYECLFPVNNPAGRHYYTTNAACYSGAYLATGQMLGVLGFVNTTPTCGAKPLYAFNSPLEYHFTYTTVEATKANLLANGFQYLGIEGYVW